MGRPKVYKPKSLKERAFEIMAQFPDVEWTKEKLMKEMPELKPHYARIIVNLWRERLHEVKKAAKVVGDENVNEKVLGALELIKKAPQRPQAKRGPKGEGNTKVSIDSIAEMDTGNDALVRMIKEAKAIDENVLEAYLLLLMKFSDVNVQTARIIVDFLDKKRALRRDDKVTPLDLTEEQFEKLKQDVANNMYR